MITIKEIIPRKLSGRTSLLVSFPYSLPILNAVREMPTYYYHKKDFTHELPTSCLAELLDKLTYLDDIDLQLLDPDSLKPVNSQPPLTEEEIAWLSGPDRKYKPMKHQYEAINFLLGQGNSLLLDSMGIGKSCEIIWYAEILKRRGLIEHCLVICGVNSLKQNWKKEILKFSKTDCYVLGEKITKTGSIRYKSVKERADILKGKIDEFFVIVNLEAIRDEKILTAFQKSKTNFGLIAFDEAHKCATKGSKQSTNLLNMDATYKVAATGTLLTSSPISCYIPLVWTKNDHSILTMFKSQYCKFGGFNDSQIVGYKDLDLLKEEIDACSIRRTLAQVKDSMPDQMITIETVEMTEEDRKFYEAIKAGVKEEADKIQLNAKNSLALVTRLRQATTCPAILTTTPPESTKLLRCCELVTELISQNEKVVILCWLKEAAKQLGEMLSSYKVTVNTSDTSESQLSSNVDHFQNDPEPQVFIGTYGKCSTGLTLNAAAYMICADINWGAYENKQGFDRIYRVTNTRPAYITILACKDTIDERVCEVAKLKQDLSDYLIDDKNNEVSLKLQDEFTRYLKAL